MSTIADAAGKLHAWRHDKARRLAAVAIETARQVLEASIGMGSRRRWVRAIHSKRLRIRRKGQKRAAAWVAGMLRMQRAGTRGACDTIVIMSERPPWLRRPGTVLSQSPSSFADDLRAEVERKHGAQARLMFGDLRGGTVSIGQRCRVIDEPGVHPVFGAYDSRLEIDHDAPLDYFEVGTVTVGKVGDTASESGWERVDERAMLVADLLDPVGPTGTGPRIFRQRPSGPPKAWGRIGSTAIGGPAFTKHTRDDGSPDYLAADPGGPLRTPGEDDDVPAPWLDGILDEVGREPMPVVELPEVGG